MINIKQEAEIVNISFCRKDDFKRIITFGENAPSLGSYSFESNIYSSDNIAIGSFTCTQDPGNTQRIQIFNSGSDNVNYINANHWDFDVIDQEGLRRTYLRGDFKLL